MGRKIGEGYSVMKSLVPSKEEADFISLLFETFGSLATRGGWYVKVCLRRAKNSELSCIKVWSRCLDFFGGSS